MTVELALPLGRGRYLTPLGQRHERAFRDTTVCIDIQGTLAIVSWMLMRAGTLAT
jgi:hypothetical protein